MVKKLALLTIVIAALFLVTSNALAKPIEIQGASTDQSEYDISETPYLLSLYGGQGTPTALQTWNHNSFASTFSILDNTPGYDVDSVKKEISNTLWWDAGKSWGDLLNTDKLGVWTWSVQETSGRGGIKNGTFTITQVAPPVPEPISAALFLLGGGALGLKLFRRRKA